MLLSQVSTAAPWNKKRSPFLPYPGQSSPFSVVEPLRVRGITKAKMDFLDWLDKQNPGLVKKAEEIAAKRKGVKLDGCGVNGSLGYTRRVPRYSQDMNVRRNYMSLNGLGDADDTVSEEKAEGAWYDSIISAVKEIAPAYLQFKQQKDIVDVQIERAKQGLPPLDTQQLAPTIRVQAEVTPEMMQTAQSGITEGLKQMALPALLLGGAAFLLVGKKRRR